MNKWTAIPVCDRCWRVAYGDRVPCRVLDDDRQPFVESCYVCDQPTRGCVARVEVDQ